MTEGIARYVERLMITEAVLKEVEAERRRQDNKWGEQNHDPFKYLAILGEEVGEANQAAVDAYRWKFQDGITMWDGPGLTAYRSELVQVAAVAVSMIESLDRGRWDQK